MPIAHCHRVVASLLLLLPWLLSGCTVYDRIFHPHRLGTPPMTAAAKAKHKAAEKARHKGLTLGAPATDGKATATKAGDADASASDATGGSADAASPEPAAAGPDAAPDAKAAGKGLPDNVRNTYDKNGHLKRSMLQRMEASSRQRHHYNMNYRGHTDVAHDARKLRKYSKHPKAKAGADDAAADASAPEPDPDPTQPVAKPAARPVAKPTAKPAAKAKAAPRVAPKAKPAAKPKPRPAAAPAAAPAPADDEPQPEDRTAKKEKPAKVKKPKRDKNGNKLPKADPTQPQED